ncbi:MAG: Uma2 family endonuclease [Planctomycetia bacterium]|nr:Uma2 family endonuclease [Planctomycetia bacterium]
MPSRRAARYNCTVETERLLGENMLQVRRRPPPPQRLPRLQAGDHLDQPTFHARYKQMPDSFRAELVEGVVFVLPPVSSDHGLPHGLVMMGAAVYAARSPGTFALNNTTIILGPESEPQPDVALLIDPACGGQTFVTDDRYHQGPPELVVEVAASTEAFDLYEKVRDYERAGVKEYLVVLVREQEVRWFERRGRRFRSLHKGRKGSFESRVFPGLRLDVAALFAFDSAKVLDELQKGLDSPQHADFVASLRKRRGG